MAEFITKCPYCDAELFFQDTCNMTIECPMCLRVVEITEPGTKKFETEKKLEHVDQESCGAEIIPEDGKNLKNCPQCNAEIPKKSSFEIIVALLLFLGAAAFLLMIAVEVFPKSMEMDPVCLIGAIIGVVLGIVMLIPSRKTQSGNAAYNLADGEEVIFELNIEAPSRSDGFEPASFIINLINSLLGDKKAAAGVLVITNMRCIVTSFPNHCCCCCGGEKFFWSFPRKALNGSNSYTLSGGCFSSCNTFKFSIGLSIGLGNDFTISFETLDVKNTDQAQAIVDKIHQLSQQEF